MDKTSEIKLTRLLAKRDGLKVELQKYQADVEEAVNKKDRRVKVEKLIDYCKETVEKALAKNDEILLLASTANNPEAFKKQLEKWLLDLTVDNDAIVRNARDYIETLDDVDGTEVASVGKLSSHISSKCPSHLSRSCKTKSLSVSSRSLKKTTSGSKVEERRSRETKYSTPVVGREKTTP